MKKSRQAQNLAISKESTIFVLSLWNLVKIITNNSQVLGLSTFFLIHPLHSSVIMIFAQRLLSFCVSVSKHATRTTTRPFFFLFFPNVVLQLQCTKRCFKAILLANRSLEMYQISYLFSKIKSVSEM